MKPTRSISPLAALPLLLIPLVLIVVALQLHRPPVHRGPSVQPPPEADYYLRGAELSTLDAQGRLIYRVRAANVLHFPDDTVDLDEVEVDYLDGPWALVAERGHMLPGAVQLDLSGDVRMRGRLHSGDEVQLETDTIRVHFEDRQIDTDAEVLVRSGQYTARARGMRTDLSGRELALLADVRVRYEP